MKISMFGFYTTPARFSILSASLALLFFLMMPDAASAQYFGRNKVQYDNFKFQQFETSHFDIYLYEEEELAVTDAARMAERWYERHSRTFLREFYERKPIIFYANDADFHQTNTVRGSLGQGTGGVTESLKERVIMPLTGSYRDTDHVLGHELVHSFQYDIALSSTDTLGFAMQLLPLWLVEGMAEYLSVGRDDPHTAMWMRDAALRNDIPTIEQITTDRKYFPYRYGQAILAYIGGKYGDAAVANLFKMGGRTGVDSAFVYTLGITTDSLSAEWQRAIREAYLPLTADRTPPGEAGRLVLAREIDAGDMNISPVLSPDGQYVAFISEKDLFNINLFIADSRSGKVLKTLGGSFTNSQFDAIRFINSSGSWSPDGKQFAFITYAEGDNEIALLNWDSGNIERRISVSGVSAITNVAWSPDGHTLAFSGMDGGISDIYLLDLESGSVRQLTDDRYSDLQPAWSPDGVNLAFISDRGEGGSDFNLLRYAKERLVIMNTETMDYEVIKPFDGVHSNPQFSPDGRNLYFISDHDGFKDIYRLALSTRDVFQVTRLQTGVSGITALSPAMSVAMQSGRMMFSVFSGGDYNVYSLEPEELVGTPVGLLEGGERITAGILPPMRSVNDGLVGNYLNDPLSGLPPDEDYEIKKYSARLKLDYVAPPSIGVTAGGPFGAGIQGGVALYFSDMLGNHNLTVVASANGTLKDVGAQVNYLNQGHRINYGGSIAHIPVLFGFSQTGIGIDPKSGLPAQTIEQFRQRIFVDMVESVAAYPFSTTRRIETSLGFTRYGFNYELQTTYFTIDGNVRRETRNLDELEPPTEYFLTAGLALINDYSSMGFTSPVRGGRSRIEVSPFIGTQNFVKVTLDYRKYFFLNPVTFAIRGLHVGNYGATNAEDEIFTQEYLGFSNSRSFVRGYSFGSFGSNRNETCTPLSIGGCAEDQRLVGTRIATTSAELRIPLLGNESFGLLSFPYLPTELSFFADAGLAWNADESPVIKWKTGPTSERIPVVSTGVSARFALFGYLIMEVYYAKPYQRPGSGAQWGLQLVPGW